VTLLMIPALAIFGSTWNAYENIGREGRVSLQIQVAWGGYCQLRNEVRCGSWPSSLMLTFQKQYVQLSPLLVPLHPNRA
jgi:hypothetical protein